MSRADVAVADLTRNVVVQSANQLRSALFAGRCIGVLLVALATIVTLLVCAHELTSLQSALLIVISAAYMVWTILAPGTLLDGALQRDLDPAEPFADRPQRVWIYFLVQLVLAELAIYVTTGSRSAQLLWLLLLPPVSHATILLKRWGLVLITCLCVFIQTEAIIHTYGWHVLPVGLAQFGLALGFVIIVTEITVRAVRSRQEAVGLAHQLQIANQQLSEYAIQAEELAATRERNRLAREIHDTVGHTLTVVNVHLEVALAMLEQNRETARDSIAKAQSMTRDGLRDIRVSVSELRTSPLDNRSLVESLRQLVSEANTTECPVTFDVVGTMRNLSHKEHLCLFRAAQEGVTNAKRHSRGTQVTVTIDYRADENVSVSVRDNGTGADRFREGFGLLGLRERAQQVEGSISFQTSRGAGFEIEVKVPG